MLKIHCFPNCIESTLTLRLLLGATLASVSRAHESSGTRILALIAARKDVEEGNQPRSIMSSCSFIAETVSFSFKTILLL